MWVCRAGKNSVYIDLFIETNKIYIPWEGIDSDLSGLNGLPEYRDFVCKKMNTDNRTSISNWAGQLKTFCDDMQIGDYVLIPHYCSRSYTLSKITGNYQYNSSHEKGLVHSRDITILCENIPNDIFSQKIRYSLGAFRTIFRVCDEKAVLNAIDDWKNKNKDNTAM